MKTTEASNLYFALTDHLSKECRRQGISLDTCDHDFILGTLMTWLGVRDLAFTGKGVRRIKSVR